MKLSPNFSRAEFRCKGCTPDKPCPRGGLDTVDAALPAALEVVRERFGGLPVAIHSGHRCEEYNSKVGGAAGSQHLQGRACDFTVQGVDPRVVADFVKSKLPSVSVGDYPGFTHIDTRTKPAFWVK